MNQFMIELKTRLEDAQKRFTAATAELQAAQARHQAIAQEVGSLQFLFNSEMRKEQGNATPEQLSVASTVKTVTNSFSVGATLRTDRAEGNKTEIVREILQQHPNGITPNDLWKSVSSQIAYRPYLYSILKRLKDKGDVLQKRKKYFPKLVSKPEEGKESHGMIQ